MFHENEDFVVESFFEDLRSQPIDQRCDDPVIMSRKDDTVIEEKLARQMGARSWMVDERLVDLRHLAQIMPNQERAIEDLALFCHDFAYLPQSLHIRDQPDVFVATPGPAAFLSTSYLRTRGGISETSTGS